MLVLPRWLVFVALASVCLCLPACGGGGLFDDDDEDSSGDVTGGGGSGPHSLSLGVGPLAVNQQTQNVSYSSYIPGLSLQVWRKTATEYRIYFSNSTAQTMHLSFNFSTSSTGPSDGRVHINAGTTLDVYEPNSNSGRQYLFIDGVRYGADTGAYYKGAGRELDPGTSLLGGND